MALLVLPLQAKLLRALQEGEIEPLGLNKLIPFDNRISQTALQLKAFKLVRAAQSACTVHHRIHLCIRRTLIAFAAIATSLVPPLALGQSGDIKIAHIYSKTGPLEAYGKQTATGFMMGLDYATNGSMMVAGKKLVVIEKDD